MNRKLLRFMIAVTFLLTGIIPGCTREKGNKIIIKGSTTVLPITQKLAEEFRKLNNSISISVSGDGSGNGIKALIDGSCDIANSSREIKKEEIKKAEAKGIKIKEILIAYDMIVPIVHPSNQITNLSADQLKAIYDGSISNWKDLGGRDERLVVISRDTSSGTYEVWEEKIMKKTEVRKDALLQASNGTIVISVADNPRAISYVGFGYINNSIKTVKVDNVDATIDNGKSGKFPVSRKLYMYVNENRLSDNAKAFIEFILSNNGQRLVKDTGFIPLR